MAKEYIKANHRWYVLSLSALSLAFCLAMPFICMSVLFDEISIDLGLSLVQVGWIWGFFQLSGLFIVFIAGLLIDRFGARSILIISCSMSGLAGASRGLTYDFTSLIFTTLLFGLFTCFIMASVFKMIAIWFPSRQLGLASGILTTGIGVGLTTGSMISATLLSPMLGSWRRVLFLYGAISIFIALLWFITIEEQQPIGERGTCSRPDFRKTISHVLHNKNVWLISLTMLGYLGCTEGMCGYLPLFLREFKEWLPASADGALAVFAGVSTLGAIPISLFSDRLGLRKTFILFIITVTIIGLGLLSVANGIIIWIIIIMTGIGRDGLVALVTASIIDSKGIGALYTGTAMGLAQTISRIGPFISPPVGNSMAASSPGLPFIVWAAFGVFALICFALTKETGHNQT